METFLSFSYDFNIYLILHFTFSTFDSTKNHIKLCAFELIASFLKHSHSLSEDGGDVTALKAAEKREAFLLELQKPLVARHASAKVAWRPETIEEHGFTSFTSSLVFPNNFFLGPGSLAGMVSRSLPKACGMQWLSTRTSPRTTWWRAWPLSNCLMMENQTEFVDFFGGNGSLS